MSRRLDVTLERLDEIVQAATPEQMECWQKEQWWGVALAVSRLRGMEMAEEEVMGGDRSVMANAYDRVVKEGEQIPVALVAAFKEVMQPSAR